MFVLVSVREVLSLRVRDLNVVAAALRALLEERLVGRVVAGAGLCVRVQELRALGDALVDRQCHVPVLATLVCFRPFVGQILDGTLASSDASQLRVSLDFFEDVIVPAAELPQPAIYVPGEVSPWYWRYDDNALFLEHGARVRVRVTAVRFEAETSKMRVEATMRTEGLGPLTWWEGAEA